MMMSNLPLDLVEEILSRVPATSMKRLRTTCKRWNALFQDRRFTEKHLSKAPKESMVLMLKEYTLCSITVNLNVAPPTIEIKGGIGLKEYSHSYLEEVDIIKVLHCHGLLLCITKDNRLVAWNPCLGETRWIQPKTSNEWYYRFALGYQKKKSGHSYKILMWCGSESQIYEFSSDSWRVLDNAALDCFILSNIVSLEGNSYWVAYDEKDKYDFILCFDFTTERFKRMCLPPLVVGQMTLSVVGETKLSLLSRSNGTSKMEIWSIWITNKIDTGIEAVVKWSKSFTLDKPISCDYFPRSFLIDEEKKVAFCCEIRKNKIYITGEDDEYYTEIFYAESTNKSGWPSYIFSYVPSLVQIQI